jgi:hypothetical protein
MILAAYTAYGVALKYGWYDRANVEVASGAMIASAGALDVLYLRQVRIDGFGLYSRKSLDERSIRLRERAWSLAYPRVVLCVVWTLLAAWIWADPDGIHLSRVDLFQTIIAFVTIAYTAPIATQIWIEPDPPADEDA